MYFRRSKGLWDYIEERVRKSAEYIVATGCTVRACSAHFNISKSTVHKDVSERLKTSTWIYTKERGLYPTEI